MHACGYSDPLRAWHITTRKIKGITKSTLEQIPVYGMAKTDDGLKLYHLLLRGISERFIHLAKTKFVRGDQR